ncbi:TonB-dependent receptor [Novosphingobium lindaniclasticum]|uniref:TonB-denpendent receptor n=1 Tax=Novosphingobium lindaniclasticum LE124 TaxID=1096930 RepID=T0HMV9_9SPHN|nr:TonB-dependent receptor [Novosphingobium lindaniclasticum]EQB14322.1 hypothetical protein L284_13075 [Novosphingobium lindaniclasticum LE124]
MAITALSAQNIRDQSVVSFTDLTKVAPNVILRQTNGGGGTVAATIRGQTIAQANIANDSPIGFYFDDVILGQPKGATAGMFDIASVEVARGVQGTLRGRNNTGGAISVYTNRPELGEYSADGGITYGSRDYLQLHAIANIPVGETLAVRLGAQRITQDAQGHSVITGQGFGGRNEWIVRAGVLFEPAPGISVRATYEHTDIDQNPAGRRLIPGSLTYNALLSGTRTAQNPSGAQYSADELLPKRFWDGATSYEMPNDRAKIDFVRAVAEAEISDDMTFKVIAGYREFVASGGIDLEGSPATQLESENGGTSKQFTIEPQLSGSLFGDTLSYVLGYYHYSDKGQLVANTYSYGINAAAPTTPFRNSIVIRENAHNISDAGYGHLEWKATDKLELAAGVRYTKDQREVSPNRYLEHDNPNGSTYPLFQAGRVQNVGCLFTSPQDGVLRPAGGFVTVGTSVIASGACPDVTLRKNYSYWSYEFTARYKIDNDLSVYARTGLGQKSGGYNIPVVSTVVPPYKPERVRDYEVGLKGSGLFGGAFDFSLAAYYSDYQNLQRYLSNLLPGGVGVSNLIINAGSARVQGLEGDFTLRPAEGFQISGFFGYTDAKYKRFDTTGIDGNPLDLSDQKFLSTPKFNSRLGFLYTRDVAGGEMRVGGGWNHQSNSTLSVIGFPGAETGKLDLFDARISWTTPNDRLEFAIYGTNLSNRKYFTDVGINTIGVSTSPTAVSGAYGVQAEPRFIGASIRFRWP